MTTGVVIGQPDPSAAAPSASKKVALLLDETGSMASIKNDVIGSVNEYFRALQADGIDIPVTLKCFNSLIGHRYLFQDKPLREIELPVLTQNNYTPDGGTPLYDAMGKLISEMRALS